MNGSSVSILLALFLASGNKQTKKNEEEDSDAIIKDEYDFIVVGAGNTGSVVAARLAELEGITTLVLEAGESGRGDPKITVPIFSLKLENTLRDWNISTVPQKHLISKDGPRTIFYPRGRVGGGTSALNYHVYVRGHEYDYKLWEDQGATGWSLEDLRKYFDKIENGVEPGMSQTVYKQGKLKLGTSTTSKLSEMIHRAANEIGIPSVNYLDGGGLKLGVSNPTRTAINGERQYALNSYLHPAWEARKQSLDIAYGALARKILFHDVNGETKAYAVRFEHKGGMREVRARKEIILSAGVINSPQLLMLSGIGPKEHLEDMGIDVVADVPGVGSNAQEHSGMYTRYYGDAYPIKNMYSDAFNSIEEYSTNGTGPMTSVLDTQCHINIRDHSKAAYSSKKYPFSDINMHARGFTFTVDSFPDTSEVFSNEYEEARKYRNGTLFNLSLMIFLAHPRSRGTVRLRSSNPTDSALYDPNILNKSRDWQLLMQALRVAEKLEQSKEFKKYGLKMVMYPDHCKIKNKNKIPRPSNYYRCYFGQVGSIFSHGSSTCKIGKKNHKMAVVDHRLRLHAVSNLRIADASVMPHVTSANLQATCYVIGEKAADMIREDWNLSVDE